MFEVFGTRNELDAALQGGSGLPSQQQGASGLPSQQQGASGLPSQQQGASGLPTQQKSSELPLYQPTQDMLEGQLYRTNWTRNNNCKGCLYYVIVSELSPKDMHVDNAVMRQIAPETPRYRSVSTL